MDLGWIYSKVKTVAPVLPAGDTTPSVNNELTKVTGGSMAIPSGEKSAKKRRKGKKKTTVANIAGSTVAPTNDDDDDEGSSKGEDVIKRALRALIQ
jgi:hypothetical protein